MSEIPEWAFGGAVGTSKASVTEQASPLIHKVKRKRTAVEEGWELLGRMRLAQLKKLEPVTVRWDELGMRDLKTEAEAFRNFAESLLALNDGEMLSKHTIVEVLSALLPELGPYDLTESVTERDRILKEIEENMEREQELFDKEQEKFEDDDQKVGEKASL